MSKRGESGRASLQVVGGKYPLALMPSIHDCIDQALNFALSTRQGNLLQVSHSFLELCGYEESELLGQNHRIFSSHFHSDFFWKQMWESLNAGKVWKGEIRNCKKTGEYFWTDTTIIPTKIEGYDEFGFLEIRHDITLKKKKELMQELYAHLQNELPKIADKKLMFQYLLTEFLKFTESEWVLGVEINTMLTDPYIRETLQVQFAQNHEPWDKTISEHQDFFKIFDPILELRQPFLIPKGSLNPLSDKINHFLILPIQRENRLLGLLGLANCKGGYKEYDFQNWQPLCHVLAQSFESFELSVRQKLLESQLHNHLILLEQSQEVAGIGGWSYDLETLEMYWTRQLYRLFGCDPTAFKPNFSSLAFFVDSIALKELQERIQGLVQRLEKFDQTVPLSPQFGAHRWVRIIGCPQLDNGKVHRVVGTVQEVTQLKQKEQEVEYQRKTALANARSAALGQMAGGIAHEINNPLTIVLGTAKHFKMICERNEISAEILQKGSDKIITATNRISKVIKGLKAFAREGSSDPIVDCAVKGIIEDTFAFCEARVHNHGIKMELPELPSDYRMRCRPVEIAQALLNLIMNSDAAVRGQESPWIRITFEQDDQWSKFRVTDSGKGITKGVSEKMMEPFYTTKEVGLGMGLGLSVVNAIVNSHSGQFFLDDQSPNTSFILKIPRKI